MISDSRPDDQMWLGIRRSDPNVATSAFVWAKDGTANFFSGNLIGYETVNPERSCGVFNFAAAGGSTWQAECGWHNKQVLCEL